VVSHELRTPLTPVLAWVRMLRGGGLDAAATAKAYEVIERNVKAQAQLIEDLLDVSRIVAGKLHLALRPLEVAPVVEAALDSVRPSAVAKGVQLTALLAAEPLVVLGDPDRLQQVVWNLLSNAIEFTPRDGRVEVAVRAAESEVEIAVRDTGKGVSPDFLPHVFDRFRQADTSSTRHHGGLGLGLSVVRHLVEQHGGRVRAESPGENRGATFTVSLPAAAAPRAPVLRRHAGAPGLGAGPAPTRLLARRRVLLVDDEADTLLTLGALLEGSGAEVRRALSAAEAIGALESWRADVLVCDIGMPGEDGFALIRKVRALPPEQGGRIPALALTAYARAEDRRRALSAGFQMHVPKPVDPDELLAAVGSLARTAAEG
jgi:CheY-like chemotaxis protein/anti-sigma regulatory factor (Ser/Thr protein kinase)